MPADERPDQDLAEALRTVAELALARQDALLSAVHAAAIEALPAAVAADPVLIATAQRAVTTHALTWLDAIRRDPLGPVPANISADAITVAEEFHRRDLFDVSITAFRAGQSEAWDRWVDLGSEVIAAPDGLRGFLAQSARSMFAYIDATTAAITAELARLGSAAVPDPEAARVALVQRVLRGEPISDERASTLLGYRLGGPHVGLVVWNSSPGAEDDGIERTVNEIIGALGPVATLRCSPGRATRWLWAATATVPDLAPLRDVVARTATIHLAIGGPGSGPDGFRATHHEARGAQRVQGTDPIERVVDWPTVELIGLITHDEDDARRFVRRTLGAFADADHELRHTIRVYLDSGHNATRTAQRVFAHRNTVLGRIARAEALLPRPLSENPVEVAAALAVRAWR